MRGKILIFVVVMLLAACGAEWFPEQPAGSGPAQPNVSSVDVGGLVASVRLGPSDYKVRTVRGTFSTYTSLGAPNMSTVHLDTYSDAVTGLQIGRMLRAQQKTVLVRDVLEMVE